MGVKLHRGFESRPLRAGPRVRRDRGASRLARARLAREDSAQRRWRAPSLASKHAAKVALIGEAEVGCQPGQIRFAFRQSFERCARTQTHAMTSDRNAGHGAEDWAEVVCRDSQRSGELGQRGLRLVCEDLACPVDRRSSSKRGAGTSRCIGGLVVLRRAGQARSRDQPHALRHRHGRWRRRQATFEISMPSRARSVCARSMVG
jgi:hypothetical protein